MSSESTNDAKLAEKYASHTEEFQKTLQSVRDQLQEDRESFRAQIEKMKQQELENLKKEAAKFEAAEEKLN